MVLRMRLLLLLLVGAAAHAQITLYELPAFRGRSLLLTDDVVNVSSLLRSGHNVVQSLAIDGPYVVTTFDQVDFRGLHATWRYSTSFTAAWTHRIRSLRVSNASARIEAPPSALDWKLAATRDGFIMVRSSTTNAGHPECHSTDAVTCTTRAHLYDLLDRNEEIESLRPAPCGPPRIEHWNSSGYGRHEWCAKARFGLSASGRHGWHYIPAKDPSGIVIKVLDESLCVQARTSACDPFPSVEVADACARALLWSNENGTYDLDAFYQYAALEDHGKSSSFIESFVFGFLVASTLLVVLAVLVVIRLRAKASRDVDATYCSSCNDLDESQAPYT
ncbi:hypothetical protein SPRG_04853 [Saprolegnia parasitica CBS 223.65]|uniref:Beta/gamma crystallin 'Greek key' domain-containing protein n=1 Tax=Saprolegnia parasitica (strain CBS 223.65) TaxID=695850 RepID=A0A067CT90_SAPPC|nr:hypothetical protein SPRG_04853 [Saprolegnia parasitica CBS 223.65]KDO29736.1 hypothetical protein SPRG_04853 [Saprolegnia parasitica CBS 223.65]|eukprot:XP_012199385.1 hypothetical protein SPRG_04853 [Saprolegnia parasitica CBS 223.65]